ncbi:erythromycin esterase family protein [Motilimonas pumila]|uniref:Chitin-binding type-3 domain-containing protein n=1 Tax=Motilimonas pumila TaxID=2303987 RepID=A0A418YKR6_9GAMM|nr:erythromycin esterase family protein [Motilimonas pumila]RJG51556.1 hypothetical protein D1Z90_02155 [Motilimonas pumila]
MFKTSKNVLTATSASLLFSAGLQAANLMDWNEDTTYDKGQKVNYHGLTYQAKWWTEDDMPSADAAGPWRLVDDGKNSAYNEDFEYKKGQVVRFDGQLWQAQWHINEDTLPGSNNSGWLNQGPSDPLLENLVEVATVDFEEDDFDDLKALKSYIGDSKIVFLGEQTHGDATTLEAKARLVKYLHQEMGFEVLAFESGFYDMAKVWTDIKSGQPASTAVLNKMFYMFAQSEQLQPLFEYIDEHAGTDEELALTGIDNRHSGYYAVNHTLSGLVEFLGEETVNQLPQVDIKRFEELTWLIMQNTVELSDDEDAHNFHFNAIATLKGLVYQARNKGQELPELSEFWLYYLVHLENQYYVKRIAPGAGTYVNANLMAYNVHWLQQTAYSGKKMIVWGHNYHVKKNPWASIRGQLKGINPELDSNSYTILFTHNQGEYADYGEFNIEPVPQTTPQSLESRLSSGTQSFGFIAADKVSDSVPVYLENHSSISAETYYNYWQPNDTSLSKDWSGITDAFFYVREEKPVTFN